MQAKRQFAMSPSRYAMGGESVVKVVVLIVVCRFLGLGRGGNSPSLISLGKANRLHPSIDLLRGPATVDGQAPPYEKLYRNRSL